MGVHSRHQRNVPGCKATSVRMTVTRWLWWRLAAGSVLLLDEANSSDVAINMDAAERERYTAQMQLIEQDVSRAARAACPPLPNTGADPGSCTTFTALRLD